ncbi:phospholipase A2 [Streptomyces sp. CB01201]|uniref:phospholipase A2 n=1 Tax=Streptomyces sp. CB01201 TaxID=2020324 RepID=UPI001F36F3AF|nr:phospholipase A2 [Streptomyces sp. CB01201]
MRKIMLPLAAALGMTMLLPQPPAGAAANPDQPLADGAVQQVGPGLYFTATNTFEINETDAPAGLMGRKHAVTEVNGVAKPQSADPSRADLGVFGQGWEAEFLGGQLNRKLAAASGAYTVTDLEVGESTRYNLTDTLSTPDGRSINKYTATDGSTLTETSKWDSNLGVMTTTIKEVVNADLKSAADSDDTFSGAAADVKPTYTWAQKAPGSDTWRVTAVGTGSTGTDTVSYDSKGRVSTVSMAAGGESPAQTLKVTYSTATTATSTADGEYTGRAKAIDLTTGTTTQTVARYSYDSTGLLKAVTNPVESTEPLATYSYDSTGRVADIVSPSNGGWDLDFTTSTDGSPNVEPVGPARPAGESTLNGAADITNTAATQPPAGDITKADLSSAASYPGHCSRATDWLWYLKNGCAAWAAHYGWHQPYWRQLPSGYWVIGILHDHCTSAPDKPSGYNFISACDMHDYGYGLIGNTYKGYRYYLDRDKKSNVDNAFHTTLRDYTCSAYRFKSPCRSIAYTYLQAVKRGGNPKNGANAT